MAKKSEVEKKAMKNKTLQNKLNRLRSYLLRNPNDEQALQAFYDLGGIVLAEEEKLRQLRGDKKRDKLKRASLKPHPSKSEVRELPPPDTWTMDMLSNLLHVVK